MIPIIREYFAGLRERDELDAILPDLLIGLGFEVISRPMTGVRQFGVDIAAVGPDPLDRIRKLFLFTVKQGDLGRSDWDGSAQAVRQSLNEIRAAYLRTAIPPQYRKLPIVICVCLGGVVKQTVHPLIVGYFEDEAQGDRRTYQCWTGDTLAAHVMEGLFREEVLPGELRADLRKAAAMVEAPDIAVAHFQKLMEGLLDAEAVTPLHPRLRTLLLAVWILFIWGREANNVEAAYRASEMAILRSWHLLWPEIERDRSRKRDPSYLFQMFSDLYLRVSDELLGAVLPFADTAHGVSEAIPSRSAVDINIALFNILGRVALRGLWANWQASPPGTLPSARQTKVPSCLGITRGLVSLIFNNPALMTPIADEQAIDIALALTLLGLSPERDDSTRRWVRDIARASMLATRYGGTYPTVDSSYSSLLDHPRRDEAYLKEATAGSVLYPTLALWSAASGDTELVGQIAEFQRETLTHSNLQLWVPNARSEGRLWIGDRFNGSSFGGLKIDADGTGLLEAVRSEIAQNSAFANLSAIRLDHWPLLLTACRAWRLPVPPQIWSRLLDELGRDGDWHSDIDLSFTLGIGAFRGPTSFRPVLWSGVSWWAMRAAGLGVQDWTPLISPANVDGQPAAVNA